MVKWLSKGSKQNYVSQRGASFLAKIVCVTISFQIERKYNIVAACDVISEMNKYIDRVNEIFKVSMEYGNRGAVFSIVKVM